MLQSPHEIRQRTSDGQPWSSWDCLVLAMKSLGNPSITDRLEWLMAVELNTSFLSASSPANVCFSYFSSEDPSTNTCTKILPQPLHLENPTWDTHFCVWGHPEVLTKKVTALENLHSVNEMIGDGGHWAGWCEGAEDRWTWSSRVL